MLNCVRTVSNAEANRRFSANLLRMGVKIWTGLEWLRLPYSGCLLWTLKWTLLILFISCIMLAIIYAHQHMHTTEFYVLYVCIYIYIWTSTLLHPLGDNASKVVVIVLCYRLPVVIVLYCYLCCSVIMVLFYVLIVCTVTLPPGVNPIAVDKYI